VVEVVKKKIPSEWGACRGVGVEDDVVLVGDSLDNLVVMAASTARSGQNKRVGELKKSERNAVMQRGGREVDNSNVNLHLLLLNSESSNLTQQRGRMGGI
jgi:hypothetical protein